MFLYIEAMNKTQRRELFQLEIKRTLMHISAAFPGPIYLGNFSSYLCDAWGLILCTAFVDCFETECESHERKPGTPNTYACNTAVAKAVQLVTPDGWDSSGNYIRKPAAEACVN